MNNNLFPHPMSLFFVGIGGIGMSGLAGIMHDQGHSVMGSDLNPSALEKVIPFSKKVFNEHNSQNISVESVDVLIYSSSVPQTNPEILEAKRLGIPVLHRHELMNFITKKHHTISVVGSHGKTTSSAMLTALLKSYKPSFLVGGILKDIQANFYYNPQSPWFVAEFDESDGSFLDTDYTFTLLTNLAFEHVEHFQSFDNIKKSFVKYVEKVPFYGKVIWCYDCPHLRSLSIKGTSYGFDQEADVVGIPISYTEDTVHFDIHFKKENKIWKNLKANTYGKHNLLNLLGAITTAYYCGIQEEETLRESLLSIPRVERRFDIVGTLGSFRFIDDYAHHPEEIMVMIDLLKKQERSLIVVFEPHRYSRFHALWNDFIKVFQTIDHLFVTDIYSAGEHNPHALSKEKFVKDLTPHTTATVTTVHSIQDLIEGCKKLPPIPSDILFVGAGKITTIARKVFESLQSYTHILH